MTDQPRREALTEEDAEPQTDRRTTSRAEDRSDTPPPGFPLSWEDDCRLVINCALLPLSGQPPAELIGVQVWWRPDGHVVVEFP